MSSHTPRWLANLVAAPWVRWLALLASCSAYLQGGLVKLLSFSGAIAEMRHFGLAPPAPFAIATIVVELGAALFVLIAWHDLRTPVAGTA